MRVNENDGKKRKIQNTFIHMSIERDLINFNLYRMCLYVWNVCVCVRSVSVEPRQSVRV